MFKVIFFLLMCFYLVKTENVINSIQSLPVQIAKTISTDLKDENLLTKVNSLSEKAFTMMGKGDFMGYFSLTEFWNIHEVFRNEHPNFVSSKIEIGKTFLKDSIYAFAVGYNMDHIDNLENLKKLNKSIILFTGLHHAREPLSMSMIVTILTQSLINLQKSTFSKEKNTTFLSNILLFVPVVNVDSYKLITESYKAKLTGHNGGYANFQKNKSLRKNRRIDPGRYCSHSDTGVDLNRNYDWKFASDNRGSSGNPCQEDYRGPKAFSESETIAIKNTIEKLEPQIVSAMNFHCWGNLWIHPFNYSFSANNPDLRKRTDWTLKYSFLEKTLKWPKKAIIGNALKAIEYVSNGEATDWMLGAKDILSYSPELGNSNKLSENFYIPSSIHSQVIKEDYVLIQDFINAHNIKMQLIDTFISITNKKQPELLKISSSSISNNNRILKNDPPTDVFSYYVFFNKGQSNHYNFQITLNTEANFLKTILDVSTAEFSLKNIKKEFDIKNSPNFDNKFFETLFEDISFELDFQRKMHSKVTLYNQNVKKGEQKKSMTELNIFDVQIPRFSFLVVKFIQSHVALSNNMIWKFNALDLEKTDVKDNFKEVNLPANQPVLPKEAFIRKYVLVQKLVTNLRDISPKVVKKISEINMEISHEKINADFLEENNITEITKENQGEITKENKGENIKENKGEYTKENKGEITKENKGEITTNIKQNVIMKDLVNSIEKQPVKAEKGKTTPWDRILRTIGLFYIMVMIIPFLACIYHYYKKRAARMQAQNSCSDVNIESNNIPQIVPGNSTVSM